MKLNIYEKKEIIKTYSAETYEIMFGTIDDLIGLINFDNLTVINDTEMIKMVGELVIKGYDSFKDLLKDIFDGLTDEELKNTRLSEVVTVIVTLIKFTIKQITSGVSEKN